METLSSNIDSIANKSLTTLLRAVEKVGQNTLAAGCGVDDSTITNDKSKFWARFTREAAIAGLKFVPVGYKCYSPEEIEHLLFFARRGMAQQPAALEWGDE